MSTETAAYPLTLDAIVQRYPGAPAPAVDNVTLEIGGGELVALLGPSGCGKTTLLRIIAGFIEQTEGKVVVGNKRIDELPPNRREVGIVFQNYALFPHMTVADNVAYGLAARGEPQAAQRERVGQMLALVQMAHLAGRYPRQMSGGQQQRVALARALAVRPRILLLDEPFAALDPGLSADMHRLILGLWERHRMNIFMITHDLKEGFELGTRLLVFDKVRLDPQAPGRYGATITYDIPLGVTGKPLLDEIAEHTRRTERFVDGLAPA